MCMNKSNETKPDEVLKDEKKPEEKKIEEKPQKEKEATPEPSLSQKRRIETHNNMSITAKVNVHLPDGRFVKAGESVEVSQAYKARLVTEKDNRFILKR